MILFLCLSLSLLSFSQNKHEIDTEFVKKNKKTANTTYFNLYLSSKNCYKCISEVHSIFSFIEENKLNLEINIVTDNIVLAKKETEGYPFKINYFVDKKIFNTYPQSFYYYKNNDVIIDSFNDILSEFRKENNDSELVKFKAIKIQDSRFSEGDLFIAGMVIDKMIVYDKVLDLGGVITSETHTLSYYDIPYSSEKIYNLPTFKIENNELVSYNDFIKNNKKKPLRSIKVSVISIYKDRVYTQFEVSQVYKDLEIDNKFNTYSFAYIAIKQIKEDDDISSIFNLDTYDSYLYTSDLNFEGKNYRLGISNYFPVIERKNNHQFISHLYAASAYVGEATLEFQNDFKSIKIIDIMPKDSVEYRISPYIKIGEDRYFINKKLDNDLNTQGVITFEKGM